MPKQEQLQRDYELLKCQMLLNGNIDPCIGIGKNSLAHLKLACSRRSGQWIVDSGTKWGMEQNKRRRE